MTYGAQQDEHVWAWRWYRFHQTGFMLGMLELTAGEITYRPIDPREYFL